MTALNSYATLSDFKAYWLNRGGQNSVDPFDDTVIEHLLKAASRHLDSNTARHFIPYIETRYFDVPASDSVDPRALKLDDDLLEVITLTNGDNTVIPSTEYTLRPRNQSPYSAIRLVDNSTFYWASDGAGDTHDVIAVYGVWGYHDRYAQAWKNVTTAAEGMDATELDYDVTDGAQFSAGHLIRFDNELACVGSKSVNTLTLLKRGENYSTAATHLTGINVSVWQPMEEAHNAVCEIANTAYHRRFGQTTSSVATVTAAGVVLSPRDIPAMAQDFIEIYRDVT